MEKQKPKKDSVVDKYKSPILFKNDKVFLASHKKHKFYTKFHTTGDKDIPPTNTKENALDKNSVYEITEDSAQIIDQMDIIIPTIQQDVKEENFSKDVLKDTYSSVKKQSSKKNKWLSLAFLLLNLTIMAGIFIYQFLNEQPVSLADLLLSKMNWWWLLIAILVFVLINFVDASRLSLGLKKITGRARPFLSYKSVAVCRFYDSMTPLSTGGQPFQIYYLTKRGVSGSTASSVPLGKYVYGQIISVLYCMVILLISPTLNLNIPPQINFLAWIGLCLSALVIVMVFWLSLSKKVAPRILIGILKLGTKLHIVKNYRSTFIKMMRTVREYNKTFKDFMQSGWLAVGEILLSILYQTLVFSTPFLAYCIFCDFDMSIWYQLLTLQAITDLVICFIPIPGGAGTAEFTFSALFATYFTAVGGQGIFVWAMLFWRILTYYGYLIQGALVMLYDFLFGNKKIAPLLQRYKDEDMKKAHKAIFTNENNE